MGKFSQILTPKWFYTIVNFWVIWLKTVDFIKDLEEGMFSWTRGMGASTHQLTAEVRGGGGINFDF